MPGWFVYVLRSLGGGFTYIGRTGNLERRVREHNAGLVRSTAGYKPLKLVAYVAVETDSRAKDLERYFKTGSGKAVLRKRILTDEVPRSET